MRLLSFLLIGCVPPATVDFGDPAQLAPLEADNRAPSAVVGEGLTLVSGQEGDRYWAHAKGLVAHDAADVWEALRVVEVFADRREVDEYTWEDNVRPEFDFSFVVHNTVRQPLTVTFDLTWVHELHDGAIAAPNEVVIRWDKTAGTQFITELAGSLVLTRLDDRTELAFIEHLVAVSRDETVLEQYLNDLFADIEATLEGRALPTY